MIYNRGDIVLVTFIFSDESGTKRRPAVVLSTAAYHKGRQEAIIAGVTGNLRRFLIGDYLISDWSEAGLLYPSIVTGIIQTVKQSMIARRLGTLCRGDLDNMSKNIINNLGLRD